MKYELSWTSISNPPDIEIIKSNQNRIYEIRGQGIMLDQDLFAFYKTETKALNLAIKRNLKWFPMDFLFQLTIGEFDALRLQIETSKGRGGTKYLPHAFTEQGVAMLIGVLNSDRSNPDCKSNHFPGLGVMEKNLT